MGIHGQYTDNGKENGNYGIILGYIYIYIGIVSREYGNASHRDHTNRDWVWWTVIGARCAGSFKDPYSRYQLSMTKCGGFLTLVSALRDLGVGCSTLRPDAHRNAEMPVWRGFGAPFWVGPWKKEALIIDLCIAETSSN